MDHRSYRYKHKSGDLYRDRTYRKQKFEKMHPEKRLKKHHYNFQTRPVLFRTDVREFQQTRRNHRRTLSIETLKVAQMT